MDTPAPRTPPEAVTGPPEFDRPEAPPDLTPALHVLLRGGSLDAAQAAAVFETIMSGRAHHGEIGALLALLATRLPTAQEILGAARVMRERVDRVETALDPADIVDTAGTGGAPKTFNVSTVAAIIAAPGPPEGGRRVAVAKHGNRSRTGRGSAEVLEALGVNVAADRATQARCLEQAGICFCFAIHHHPAALHAMPVRMALGFPTLFNLLGPLTNPAGARRQLMGVYARRFMEPIAGALAELGTVRAMIVHSDDGLDELAVTAPSTVLHVRGGAISKERIDPGALGLATCALEKLVAPDLESAVRRARRILEGAERGPARGMALLNAAATLLVGDVVETLEEGLVLAAQRIDSGQAAATLERLAALSNE